MDRAGSLEAMTGMTIEAIPASATAEDFTSRVLITRKKSALNFAGYLFINLLQAGQLAKSW
jgi:hypothetical protein